MDAFTQTIPRYSRFPSSLVIRAAAVLWTAFLCIACTGDTSNLEGDVDVVSGADVQFNPDVFPLPDNPDTKGDVNTNLPPEPLPCESLCELRECGPDGCGGSCGQCDEDSVCTLSGQCVDVGDLAPLGGACGPTDACQAEMVDEEGNRVANPQWPDCLHGQCASNLCRFPVCTQPCAISKDEKINGSGNAGSDGVEDEGNDSCVGATSGPLGDSYRCVALDENPVQEGGLCLAGTTFSLCGDGMPCSEGEICTFLSINGEWTPRCVAALPDAASVGAACGSEFVDDGICAEPGLCDEDGCSGLCETSGQCLTADAQCVEGSCANNEEVSCEVDEDCSAWACNGNLPIEWEALGVEGACAPRACESNSACVDPDFVCRMRLGEPSGGEVDWSHGCIEKGEEINAGVGDPCSNDPESGVVCEVPELCYKGQCSALCTQESDCDVEAGQLCAAVEIPFDLNGDSVRDVSLPLALCEPLPHEGELTECVTNQDCVVDGESCVPVELPTSPGSTFSYELKRYCRSHAPEFGGYGEECGLEPGEGECKIGFCTVDDVEGVMPSMCTQSCASQNDCPDLAVGSESHPSICRSVIYGWNGTVDPKDDLYVPICWPSQPGSSLADCSGTLSCEASNEACVAWPIATSPELGGEVEYLCMKREETEEGQTLATLGESCQHNGDCVSLMCLPGLGGEGYCSSLCDQDMDCLDGGPFMVCDEHVAIPRKSTALDLTVKQCRLAKTCIPCEHHNDCTQGMKCIQLDGGQGFYCAQPCSGDDDCLAADGGETCAPLQGPDGPGESIKVCEPSSCQ